MHCASGARIALVKRSQKARGRPPKKIEESKSSQDSVDSEFDYRCKKEAAKPRVFRNRRVTRSLSKLAYDDSDSALSIDSDEMARHVNA